MEEFKTIQGFSRYQISNLGNVKSFCNKEPKILSPNINKSNGYKYIVISDDNKKIQTKNIHRLVGITFIDNPDNKIEIDHIDGNKLNNNKDNLRWATHNENNRNKGISPHNTSGVKGVDFNKQKQKWRLRMLFNGGNYCKFFNTIEEAKQERLRLDQINNDEFMGR